MSAEERVDRYLSSFVIRCAKFPCDCANMTESTPNGIKISVVDVPKTNLSPMKDTKKVIYPKDTEKGELHQPSYITVFAAEVLGTGFLMFLGCMGCLTKWAGGITFGLTVMMIIQTFGHISGAHLNPAVTIATVIFGTVKPVMAVVYVVAQFVGAILGYGLLKILGSDYISEGFCATVVDDKISALQGLGIEIVITTFLILVCAAIWDKRNADKPDSVALKFGFVVAAISIAGGPLTGASMNTARSFAPLVFGGSWKDHWIYWVGPNVASLIGCGIYKFLFALPSEDKADKENICLEENTINSAQKV